MEDEMQQDDHDRPGDNTLKPPVKTKPQGQKAENPDQGQGGTTMAASDPTQIIADAIQRHVPTASSDQAQAAAKDAIGRLKNIGK
jgi:hypothetical protein